MFNETQANEEALLAWPEKEKNEKDGEQYENTKDWKYESNGIKNC